MTATSTIGPRDAYGRHSTYVQIRGPGGFFASCCVCGSDSFPSRLSLAAAEADARAHGELRHLYDRECLLAHEAA
jgi:hypothetical protein